MKQLSLSFLLIILPNIIFAQCYIQYTYDSSGNRIKREYVGGCAKPIVEGQQMEMKLDTLQITSIESRTERIRQDMDMQITLYPNPTVGPINIHFDNYEPAWTYKLTDLSGHVLKQSFVASQHVEMDIGSLPPSPYILAIYDSVGQIIFQTNIIKQ